MDEKTRKLAIEIFESGEVDDLYTLIKPFIEVKDPFALHLFSNFSLTEFGEIEEEFSERSINLKVYVSESGVAEASYRMGVNYLYGDNVPQSYKEAASYFERAISQGHTHTKFTYGYSLYHGIDKNSVDTKRGGLY